MPRYCLRCHMQPDEHEPDEDRLGAYLACWDGEYADFEDEQEDDE